MEYTFKITNFTCGACVKVSTMVLKKMEGVENVDIQQDGSVKIVSSKPIDLNHAKELLNEKGYEAVIG